MMRRRVYELLARADVLENARDDEYRVAELVMLGQDRMLTDQSQFVSLANKW